MATVTLQGNPFNTNGDLPAVGSAAPDFGLVTKDLADVSLKTYAGKKKLISIVPSLDTGVCAASTKVFNDRIKGRGDAVVLVFRNAFARRILAADPTAGIEAPLPIQIRETKTGTVIAWKRPSDVYRPYPGPEIARVARELDAIFARIAADALIP